MATTKMQALIDEMKLRQKMWTEMIEVAHQKIVGAAKNHEAAKKAYIDAQNLSDDLKLYETLRTISQAEVYVKFANAILSHAQQYHDLLVQKSYDIDVLDRVMINQILAAIQAGST